MGGGGLELVEGVGLLYLRPRSAVAWGGGQPQPQPQSSS